MTRLAPSYLSLPDAAALPVIRMTGFSIAARRRLLQQGIVSALQLAEIASRDPAQLRHRTGVTFARARRVLEAELGAIPDFSRVAASFQPLPMPGVRAAGAPPGPRRLDAGLDRRLAALKDLPTQVSLSADMQPVRNQGPFGTCVGHAVTALREYAWRQAFSPGFAYAGAKSLDGYSGQGTWLYYATQFQYATGAVPERAFPDNGSDGQVSIGPFLDTASRYRSAGHAMLATRTPGATVRLFKAVLAGRLHREMPPLPIAVSLLIYPSFITTSSALDGLVALPLPGETPRGGHAMVLTGYVEARDPTNPFGIDFFLTRNSWGQDWARHNPFGHPGHAMIPAAYLAGKSIQEAYVVLEAA